MMMASSQSNAEAGSNEDDEEITRIEDLPQEPGSCWGCCICISLFLFLYSFLFLGLGYSSDAYKARNTAEDFVSIGKRCRIEDITYQAITSDDLPMVERHTAVTSFGTMTLLCWNRLNYILKKMMIRNCCSPKGHLHPFRLGWIGLRRICPFLLWFFLPAIPVVACRTQVAYWVF